MRKGSKWVDAVSVVAVMVVLQASVPSFPSRATAEEPNGPCDGVECGMGSCQASPDRAFGFECNCVPGWSQFLVNRPDDPFRFLPCILPNCTFSYSCYNESIPHRAPPIPVPHNLSLFDPCFWSYCGNGNCVRTTGFKHQCECRNGFSNFLNITSFPCVRDCTVGANCTDLGFPLSNGPFSPSPTNFVHTSGQASASTRDFLWLFLCASSVAIVQATWMKF